jgi:integrase/recombinase XerC
MLPALINTEGGGPGDGGVVVPRLDDLVEAFLASLRARTRLAYERDLRDFARYALPDAPAPDTRAAVALLIASGAGGANLLALGYRQSLEARGLAAATVARRLSALRSALEFAGALGLVHWSLRVIRPRVVALRDVRGPGVDGWRRMVGQLGRDRGAGPGRANTQATRDLSLVRLLHDLMLRRSEVAELDLAHVELEAGRPTCVWVLGKGRSARERMVLPPVTAAALADWLSLRGAVPGPLFVRVDGQLGDGAVAARLSDRSIARAVNRLGERAGLSRRVAPHGLRHEAITRAVEMGQPLRDVQLSARHKDPRTTQAYIDRVNNPQPKISRLISED